MSHSVYVRETKSAAPAAQPSGICRPTIAGPSADNLLFDQWLQPLQGVERLDYVRATTNTVEGAPAKLEHQCLPASSTLVVIRMNLQNTVAPGVRYDGVSYQTHAIPSGTLLHDT